MTKNEKRTTRNERRKIRVGIVGCGAMGTQIALACVNKLKGSFDLRAICDVDANKADILFRLLKRKVKAQNLDRLVKSVDLVVEAASGKISAGILSKCIKSGRDCLIMSVGGLLGHERLLKTAASEGIKVYIPSGALAGIDALNSAAAGKIESVTLTTRKPPRGLKGAPYLKKRGIILSGITEEVTVFEGSALDAVRGFPANVNVSAILSLAGIGSKKTRVRIVTSPAFTRNSHEVQIVGDFGTITARTDNVPSAVNPKTSGLAIYSAISTLANIAKSVRIGT